MERESRAREAGASLPCHSPSYQLVSGDCPQVRPKGGIITPSINRLASAWPRPITQVTPSAASACPWIWRSLRCLSERDEVFSYRQVLLVGAVSGLQGFRFESKPWSKWRRVNWNSHARWKASLIPWIILWQVSSQQKDVPEGDWTTVMSPTRADESRSLLLVQPGCFRLTNRVVDWGNIITSQCALRCLTEILPEPGNFKKRKKVFHQLLVNANVFSCKQAPTFSSSSSVAFFFF